jgi:hypothetical protein
MPNLALNSALGPWRLILGKLSGSERRIRLPA